MPIIALRIGRKRWHSIFIFSLLGNYSVQSSLSLAICKKEKPVFRLGKGQMPKIWAVILKTFSSRLNSTGYNSTWQLYPMGLFHFFPFTSLFCSTYSVHLSLFLSVRCDDFFGTPLLVLLLTSSYTPPQPLLLWVRMSQAAVSVVEISLWDLHEGEKWLNVVPSYFPEGLSSLNWTLC